MSEARRQAFTENTEDTQSHTEIFSANLCTVSAPSVNLSLYPWEDIDMVLRQQAEDEIWADAEHDAWLNALLADQQQSLTGSDPDYERWLEAGAPGVTWSLLDSNVAVLPDYQRDDWVGA